MSNKHPALSIQYQTSSIQHQVSSIQHPNRASITEHPISTHYVHLQKNKKWQKLK